MTALITCPDCGRVISKMPPACPACGRTFIRNDYDGFEEEEKEQTWALRPLFFVLAPLLTVGGFLVTVVEGLLGFGFVFAGVIALPTDQVWGGASIAFGVGVWIVMIGWGIQAAFVGR